VLKRTIDASIDILSRRHRLLRSLVPLNNLNDRTTSALLDDDYSIQQLLGSSAPSLRDRPPQTVHGCVWHSAAHCAENSVCIINLWFAGRWNLHRDSGASKMTSQQSFTGTETCLLVALAHVRVLSVVQVRVVLNSATFRSSAMATDGL
jgi:hypothetical protein